MARLDELLHHGMGEIDRDREAVPRIEAGLARDGRVDPNDVAAHVDERSARIPRVDRGVGLDEVLDRVARLLQPVQQATFGAHDARGHREGERFAQGVADREHPLAHAGGVGVAEAHGRQVARVNLDDGHVRRRIGAHDLGGELTLVVQPHHHAVRARNHVIVGEDVAVRRDDEAGAGPLLHLGAPAELRKEVLKPGRQASRVAAGAVLRPDEHDGGPHVIGHSDKRAAQVRDRFRRGQRCPRGGLQREGRLGGVAPFGEVEG